MGVLLIFLKLFNSSKKKNYFFIIFAKKKNKGKRWKATLISVEIERCLCLPWRNRCRRSRRCFESFLGHVQRFGVRRIWRWPTTRAALRSSAVSKERIPLIRHRRRWSTTSRSPSLLRSSPASTLVPSAPLLPHAAPFAVPRATHYPSSLPLTSSYYSRLLHPLASRFARIWPLVWDLWLQEIAPTADLLEPLLPPNPYMKSLKLDCSRLDDSSIRFLVKPSLQDLCLHNCENLSGRLLAEIGGKCRDLR